MSSSIDDLVKLSPTPLSLNQILDCLEQRFIEDIYYTEAAVTLIAFNPFKNNQYLYSEQCMKIYHDYYIKGNDMNNDDDDDPIKEENNKFSIQNFTMMNSRIKSKMKESFNTKYNLSHESNLIQNETYLSKNPPPPHIYKYASLAWKRILKETNSNIIKDQSIIVSGESGSGKTKTISYIISYFSFISSHNSSSSLIENNLIHANTILESFGNARTTLNDNSSRFGKYIELRFNANKQMTQARIFTYLLEKTRIVNQQSNENNFHIFYQLINGSNDLEKLKLLITKELSRNFKSSNSYNDLCLWKIFKNSFNQLKLDSYLECICQIIVSIAHLTCTVYNQVTLDDNIELKLDSKSIEHLKHAAYIIGFDLNDLDLKLREREISVIVLNKLQSIKIKSSLNEIDSRKDCLAKLLYSELFLWLVNRLNEKLKINDDKTDNLIGLLDIYGFENNYTNSLEQLCINYSNERLQQIFIDYFIKTKQSDFAMEGIKWKYLNYTDNQIIVDSLHTGPKCLFNILNEECFLKREVEPMKLKTKIMTMLGQEDHIKCRSSAIFCIRHYAGDVFYRIEGLIEKNRDAVPQDLLSFMSKSKNSFLLEILKTNLSQNNVTQNGSKTNLSSLRTRSHQSTVLTRFKSQLDDLIIKLKLTRIQYIRCIKPNENFCPKAFDRLVVMRQLEASGIVSIMNINRTYYPHKLDFKQFLDQYLPIIRFKDEILVKQVLSSKKLDDLIPEALRKLRHIVKLVLGKFNKSDYLVGKKVVFVNDKLLNQLDDQLFALKTKMAIKIQKKFKMHLAKKFQVRKKISPQLTNRSCSSGEIDIIIGYTNENTLLRDTKSCPEFKIIRFDSTTSNLNAIYRLDRFCVSSKCNLNDSNIYLFYVSDSATILTKRRPNIQEPSLEDCL